MERKNKSQSPLRGRKRRNSITQPPEMSEVNIMLLGKTGTGKSASGNTIIGVQGTFEEEFSPASETRSSESAQTVVNGQTISVIDTVGLTDTEVKITDAQTEIGQILQSTRDGFDVFLLVIKPGGTFTEFERNAAQWIQDHFGSKFLLHTIVLFTHGDYLYMPIEKYLIDCETMSSLVDQCSGGFHVFNNEDKDRSQVTELLDKINRLRMKNGYSRYTQQDYKEMQDKILLKRCIAGGAAGAAVGGAAGATIAAKLGAAALTVGKAAVLGGTGGAVLLAAAAYTGVLWAKKYNSKRNDKSD